MTGNSPPPDLPPRGGGIISLGHKEKGSCLFFRPSPLEGEGLFDFLEEHLPYEAGQGTAPAGSFFADRFISIGSHFSGGGLQNFSNYDGEGLHEDDKV